LADPKRHQCAAKGPETEGNPERDARIHKRGGQAKVSGDLDSKSKSHAPTPAANTSLMTPVLAPNDFASMPIVVQHPHVEVRHQRVVLRVEAEVALVF